MQVREALERLNLIHDQLTKSEVYRGFRVPTVAAVGFLGLGAAAIQPVLPHLESVWYWMAIAGACAALSMAAALHSYANREDEFERRRTRRVMAQFLPCLVAGGAITAGLARAPELIAFLPGLWAVLFGLGVVAARPHLPPATGMVGLGYIVVGAVLVLRAPAGLDPSPWSVGGVFGVGHLATALVLWQGTGRDAEGDTNE
jgi:hypothetical protein